jgi:O-antigen/teichoic acid export membrane protein
MLEKIKNIIRTKTFRQSIITSSGTIINGLIGWIFYILAARNLGPAKFGIFSVATATIALLASVFNVGVDTGLVRFVGRYISSEKEKALRFMKLGLKVKIISGLILITLGWFLVPLISTAIFNKPELTFPLRLSLIGAFGWLLSFFVTSNFQAMQKFFAWSGINIFMTSLRVIAILGLIKLGISQIDFAIYAYIYSPFIGFLIGLTFLPNFFKIKNENLVAKEFFHYNKWVAAFTIIAAISSRLDTYISTRLLSFSDLGIYSVANNLSNIVSEIVLALATVVAPKLASFTSDFDAKRYLKKLQGFVLFLGMAGVSFGIPFSYFVIPKLYGLNYLASITPFIILLISQAIFLISVPVHTSVFYYFSKPKVFFFISIGHFVLVSLLGWFLIGKFSYIGAAVTMLAGNIFNFLTPATWVVYQFNKRK